MKTYSLVNDQVKGHEFVNGNTKYLRDMDQKDLAVLFKNGDTRVKEEEQKTEDKKAAKPALPAPTV